MGFSPGSGSRIPLTSAQLYSLQRAVGVGDCLLQTLWPLGQWGQWQKALAQIENRVCPVSGEGEEGPMVHGRYLVAALPRAPFLAKSILMGKQWCWPQVVNWEGREARKLSVLSAPVSKILPTSPPATWHINPSRALSTALFRLRDLRESSL